MHCEETTGGGCNRPHYRGENDMSMTRLEMFVNLGYKIDPFKKARFETGDGVRVRKILAMAVESHAMVSIIGERGIGKSAAVEAALAKIGARIVTVQKAEKERVSISDIERAMILDLCDEKPKGGGETRSRQLRPIVGEISRKGKVVLVLEEAQRLHGATLKSLKTLREMNWMGESELFTVVLIGQSDPMRRAGVSEVRLRTDCVHMQGLTTDEAAGYVNATIGKHFEPTAIEALTLLPQATNFLELQELCITVLNYAISAGRKQVSIEDVRTISPDKQTALPRSLTRSKAQKAAGGNDALKSVLRRRNESAIDTKEAVAC